MKFTAMMAAVTMATGLRAQETDDLVVKALDNREVIDALMTIFKQTSGSRPPPPRGECATLPRGGRAPLTPL